MSPDYPLCLLRKNPFHSNLRVLRRQRNFISLEIFYIHNFYKIVVTNFTIFLSKFFVFSLFCSIKNFPTYNMRIAFNSTSNSASIDVIVIEVLQLDFEQ